jgi:hypothetical protein
MEIGLARGLAQDLQYDQRIADLRYQQQEMDRATAINDAKAKMFSDDMDFQNATNSFDNPRIKEFAKNQIAALGKYVTENPDWASNVQKRSQVNLMKRELKDNPMLHQGLASDAALKQYNADLAEVAKNPEFHNKKAYEDIAIQAKNYTLYGNQDGEEAAKKFGTKAFVYTKPREFRNVTKDWAALGNDFKDLKRNPMAGKGRNAFQEYANPDSLRAMATQYYSENPEQMTQDAAKAGMEPIAYIMKGLDGYIPKKTDYGDYNLSDAMTMKRLSDKPEEAKGPTTWDVEIKGKDKGMESGDTMMKVLGPPAGIKIKDYNGNPVDMTGINFKYTGNHERVKVKVMGNDGKYKDAYQKLFEVYTEVPIKVSNELGFTEDPWLGGVEVSDKFKGKNIDIVTRQNSKGEAVKYARIKTKVPVDVDNEGFRQRYDAENMASKFRQGVDQGVLVEYDDQGRMWNAETKQLIK